MTQIGPPLPVEVIRSQVQGHTGVDAGWSSWPARKAHIPEIAGSNPVPATAGDHVNKKAEVVCNGIVRRPTCGCPQVEQAEPAQTLATPYDTSWGSVPRVHKSRCEGQTVGVSAACGEGV